MDTWGEQVMYTSTPATFSSGTFSSGTFSSGTFSPGTSSPVGPGSGTFTEGSTPGTFNSVGPGSGTFTEGSTSTPSSSSFRSSTRENEEPKFWDLAIRFFLFFAIGMVLTLIIFAFVFTLSYTYSIPRNYWVKNICENMKP